MKKKNSNNTVITFKFEKNGGFRIGASDGSGRLYGNFFPEAGFELKKVPGMAGNTWVQGVDLTKVFEVELEAEVVRGLPAHIASHEDDSVKNAYRSEQAKIASEAHRRNNEFRDELAYYQESGLIKILSDSFMDEQKVLAEDVPVAKVGRPKKSEEVV